MGLGLALDKNMLNKSFPAAFLLDDDELDTAAALVPLDFGESLLTLVSFLYLLELKASMLS